MAEGITEQDVAENKGHEALGPAYFTARRAAAALMQGATSQPFDVVVKKCGDDLTHALYEYLEVFVISDLQAALHDHIHRMVDNTVEALLTGQDWAMQRYPFADYDRGKDVREAVAKHGGEPLLMRRITDLEETVTRLKQVLRS